MLIPQARKRATHSKSHTGCYTCRARHVKCDETRPFCNRCTKLGRVCDGYRPPTQRPVTRPMPVICPRPLPREHIRNLTDVDGHALQFWTHHTVHQLPCAASFETPWEQIASQLAWQQPCVSDLCIALASLHRTITQGDEGPDITRHQLTQHNKSLVSMRKYIGELQSKSTSTDEDYLVLLIACLLSFTYNVFAGNDEQASFHLRTGLRVIHERCQPATKIQAPPERRAVLIRPKAKSLFDVLVQTFIRLDSDITLTGYDDPYLYPVCADPMPSRFSSPDEASNHLEAITAKSFDLFDLLWDHTYHSLSKHRDVKSLDDDMQNSLVRAALRTVELNDSLSEGIEQTRCTLRAWSQAFSTPPTQKNLVAHLSAQIFFFCIWIWVETWRDATATLADRFEAEYEYMAGLCEQYVELHISKTPFHSRGTKGASQTNTPPAFSLGSGVVTCLAAVVEKCRNSSIRQRCIATLQKINLRGIFETGYLVAYLQAIIEYEEDAARLLNAVDGTPPGDSSFQAREIPEAARLLEVVMSPSYGCENFEFYKSKEVALVYAVHDFIESDDGLALGRKVVRIL